tara:strand:- start:215 stop:598 length:384 start_codon:yes stop_codon:yes gene_type:complete
MKNKKKMRIVDILKKKRENEQRRILTDINRLVMEKDKVKEIVIELKSFLEGMSEKKDINDLYFIKTRSFYQKKIIDDINTMNNRIEFIDNELVNMKKRCANLEIVKKELSKKSDLFKNELRESRELI